MLVLHDRLGIWLQPGGHVEPSDPDVLAAAQREVREETGAVIVTPAAAPLVGVSVHEIPAARGEPRHMHHDLVFALVATSDEVRASPETRAVVWCPVEDLGKYQVDDGLLESVERAVRAT